MNIPVIIKHKTRTGLAVKYPMGKIEEVILEEGMYLSGTCGKCRLDGRCALQQHMQEYIKPDGDKKIGCIDWEKRSNDVV